MWSLRRNLFICSAVKHQSRMLKRCYRISSSEVSETYLDEAMVYLDQFCYDIWLRVRFHAGLDEFHVSLLTNDFMILNFHRVVQREFGFGFVLQPSLSKHLFLWE